MVEIKKRYIFSASENSLPLYVESLGYNPQEEDFARPEGYPYYHWLQTVEGEGVFTFDGEEYKLSKGQGILLLPFTPHSYFTSGQNWATIYMTFSGAAIEAIMSSLDIHHSSFYSEKKNEPALSQIVYEIMNNIEDSSEFSRLDTSESLFGFMIALKKYGDMNKQHSLTQYYEKVRPLVNWLEEHYSEDIGLQDMVEKTGLSSQYLTTLFKETLKMSPYTFLIQLRIREAKKKILTHSDLPLKDIAKQVGFNDVSHFIATFKRLEGITPKKYSKLFNRTLKNVL